MSAKNRPRVLLFQKRMLKTFSFLQKFSMFVFTLIFFHKFVNFSKFSENEKSIEDCIVVRQICEIQNFVKFPRPSTTLVSYSLFNELFHSPPYQQKGAGNVPGSGHEEVFLYLLFVGDTLGHLEIQRCSLPYIRQCVRAAVCVLRQLCGHFM